MERFVFIRLKSVRSRTNDFAKVPRSVQRNKYFHTRSFVVIKLTSKCFVIKEGSKHLLFRIQSQNGHILKNSFVDSMRALAISQHQRVAEEIADFSCTSLFSTCNPSAPLSNSHTAETILCTLMKHGLQIKPLHYGMLQTSSCPIVVQCNIDRAPTLKLFHQF